MDKKNCFLYLLLLLSFTFSFAQTEIYDSGGPLLPEQAAYDVSAYEITLEVFPDERKLAGKVMVSAHIVQPSEVFVLDLDTILTIDHISLLNDSGGYRALNFQRQAGKVWIDLNQVYQPGMLIQVEVAYHGLPRTAPYAPWDGGFSWAKTKDGDHWIATSCQGEGPDIWWPSKDHVSDKADSVKLHITVPDPLVVATNGRFQSKNQPETGKTTYHWLVSTPINSYNIALNIAPYDLLETEFTSVSGEVFPFVFYCLPKDRRKAEKLFPEMQDHLQWYESLLGPYPFRADKYGVAQTPHLGMEHQTIIAYGANFRNGAMTGKDWGFDALHHHELAHEWWGNLVTNADWKDMWIHEGFGSYMQPLYAEHLEGKDRYFEYMRGMRRMVTGLPIAPLTSQTADEIYRAPIYTKGAWVLHTLRYLIGEEPFFQSLRQMAYPDEAMALTTDGDQCRFVSTADFINICETNYGQDLQWFFDIYLRQSELPVLRSRIDGNVIRLSWQTPEDLPFPMPVTVVLGDRKVRLDVPREGVTYEFQPGQKPEVDPNQWILCTLAPR